MLAWIIVALVVICATVAYVVKNYIDIKAMPEGTEEMVEMAGIIRSGANTFMLTEYKTIAIVVAVLAIVFSLFIEKTAGITLLMGACMSSIVCANSWLKRTFWAEGSALLGTGGAIWPSAAPGAPSAGA